MQRARSQIMDLASKGRPRDLAPPAERTNNVPRRRRLMPSDWPISQLVLATVAAMAIALWESARIHHYTQPTDFALIGQRSADALGLSQLATSPGGFDGQFYYAMARFPGQMPLGAFDDPAKRYSRMLYPLIVHLVSAGQATLIPWTMLVVNVLAIAAAVLITAILLKERGLPAWPALVAGLYCGQPLALARDLTDPLAVLWIAIALFGLHRGRWLLTAAALGFGMLTRESTLVFIVCLAVPLLIQRRWHMLLAYSAVALGPYAAWTLLVALATGHLGFGQAAKGNAFVLIPFSGLASAVNMPTAIIMVVFAVIPTVVAIALGLKALGERPWHDAFRIGVALSAIGYGLATALQPGVQWIDIWGPLRIVSPLALLVLLLPPVSWPNGARTVWKGTVALMLFSYCLALAM